MPDRSWLSEQSEAASCSHRPAPLHDEPAAAEERGRCDYGVRISRETAAAGKAPRKVRLFVPLVEQPLTCSVARRLLTIKRLLPDSHLIVGVFAPRGPAADTELLRHIRYLDEVLVRVPRVIDGAFVAEHKIDFVVGDHVGSRERDNSDSVQRSLEHFNPRDAFSIGRHVIDLAAVIKLRQATDLLPSPRKPSRHGMDATGTQDLPSPRNGVVAYSRLLDWLEPLIALARKDGGMKALWDSVWRQFLRMITPRPSPPQSAAEIYL